MTTTMRLIVGSFAAWFALGAVAAEPSITDVVVRQRWPWSRLVDIDYVLTCKSGAQMDVAVQAYDGETPLALPLDSFSGDLYGVQRGARQIVWDPTMTACTNSKALPKFRVALTPVPPPLYMIVSLTNAVGTPPNIEYVYEADLTNGLWGSWVRNPVTNRGSVIESVVWTGVTTNNVYKTDKLVLRRIHATTFNAGDTVPPTSSTTLTKDFYAGVFEVTQRQWERIMGDGSKPSYFTADYAARPVERVTYDDIRGATNSTPPVNWPSTGRSLVASGSFLGQCRAKTGLTDIDLPTSAQWELLARAGTTTYYNDGEAAAPIDGVSQSTTLSNLFMDVIGRYRYNGGFINNGASNPIGGVSPANGTALAGSYLPNAWGLYDTIGNVMEWCLDWYGNSLSGTDPIGAESGEKRIIRGGNYGAGAGSCRVGPQSQQTPAYVSSTYGFRLVRNLP